MSKANDLTAVFNATTPLQRVKIAHEIYGNQLVLLSSFGVRSAIMLYFALMVNPRMKILHVNTGNIAPSTLNYRENLKKKYDLNLTSLQASEQDKGTVTLQGLRELGAQGFLRGIRQDQTPERAQKQIVEYNAKTGMTRIYPILDKSRTWADEYMQAIDHLWHPEYKPGAESHGGNILPAGSQKTECALNYSI